VPKNGSWSEVDPLSARTVNQKYGAKLDKERDRKSDVITQIIAEEALKGNLYSSVNQFAETFENQAGLGSNKSIRDRISVLATKGYIKFIKDADHLGITHIRSSNGILCVENMQFKQDDDTLIYLLPTHYKNPQTGAKLPVENPEIWVLNDGEN
jgi:hypothetical protein